MRALVFLLVAAGLTACAPSSPAASDKKVISFDGAGAKDAAAIRAHGERLTHVLGCRGCHTPTLEGQWFNDDQPTLGKLYASNLTRVIPTMSDEALEKLLRTGRHPKRGDLWIMPSEIYQRLSAPDMAALIAHLRTIKPSGAPTPPPALSAAARKMIADGKLKPVEAYVAEYQKTTPPDLGPSHALGRYIAAGTCAECHGADLKGVPDFEPGLDVPDLDIVGTYSDKELEKLLVTGEGKTRKDLGLMTLVAKGHFAYLTPHERNALIAYLRARAGRPR